MIGASARDGSIAASVRNAITASPVTSPSQMSVRFTALTMTRIQRTAAAASTSEAATDVHGSAPSATTTPASDATGAGASRARPSFRTSSTDADRQGKKAHRSPPPPPRWRRRGRPGRRPQRIRAATAIPPKSRNRLGCLGTSGSGAVDDAPWPHRVDGAHADRADEPPRRMRPRRDPEGEPSSPTSPVGAPHAPPAPTDRTGAPAHSESIPRSRDSPTGRTVRPPHATPPSRSSSLIASNSGRPGGTIDDIRRRDQVLRNGQHFFEAQEPLSAEIIERQICR